MKKSNKQSSPWGPRLLPVITLLVLGSGAYFIYAQFRPALFGETAGSIKSIDSALELGKFESDRTAFDNSNSRNISADEYRKLARQIDAELQAKLKRKKESRISTQGREAQIQLYDRQLAERQEVYEKFKDQSEDEHSIGYGMKQEIEMLKSDPPSH